MIHFLNGKLVSLQSDRAIIECSGVGFSVGISVSTCSKLASKLGKEAMVYTYMAVSEDAMSLYGFSDEDELDLFKKLISVSGIGPKGAISILGTLTPETLRTSVSSGDAKMIAQAPGVGLKTAQKLIIELKDKIGASDADEIPVSQGSGGEKISQVIDTLTLYGFSRGQVVDALKKSDRSLPLEALISETLRTLGKEGRI